MNKITANLKEEISSNNQEIKRLTSLNEKLISALSALQGEKAEPVISEVTEKRKYTKRSKKWKKSKNRLRRKPRKINGESKNIAWKERLTAYVAQKGKLINTEDVLNHFYPSQHHKTRRVLRKRIDSILYWYAKKGTFKCYENGQGKYYGSPSMFAGNEVISTYKPY